MNESSLVGSTQITYRIMTDADGIKWKVPTHIDGDPVEYLCKYDPDELAGTFVTIEPQSK